MRVGHFAAGVVLAICGWLSSSSATAAGSGDACREQLPQSLVAAVAHAFPGFELPLFMAQPDRKW